MMMKSMEKKWKKRFLDFVDRLVETVNSSESTSNLLETATMLRHCSGLSDGVFLNATKSHHSASYISHNVRQCSIL